MCRKLFSTWKYRFSTSLKILLINIKISCLNRKTVDSRFQGKIHFTEFILCRVYHHSYESSPVIHDFLYFRLELMGRGSNFFRSQCGMWVLESRKEDQEKCWCEQRGIIRWGWDWGEGLDFRPKHPSFKATELLAKNIPLLGQDVNKVSHIGKHSWLMSKINRLLCMCILHYGTFLCCPLQNNNVGWPNSTTPFA